MQVNVYLWRFLLCLVSLMLIVPIVLQYIFKWHVVFGGKYNITVYGFYLTVYMIIQFVFSWFVRSRRKIDKRLGKMITNVNVMVVGYREDKTYFKMCLESLKTVLYNTINLNKIYIIIDGNDHEDRYMIDECDNMFKNTNRKYVHLDIADTSEESILVNYLDIINENDIICISQKHMGKRHVMMTGFRVSLLENSIHDRNIETIFCTDSDTVIGEDCIKNMYSYFGDSDVGAVTGNLGIYNKYDSVISFLSSMKYWSSFNIERAYQSFTGNVLCISGPIGMYKLDSLEQVIKEWSEQTFLGDLCTYGDDRHLTNKILSLGKRVEYVSTAIADTETPSELYRFYKQQVRWNKSAFRELFWSVSILDKHSFMMTIDIIYTMLFPYTVMGYLMYVLWVGTVFELGYYMAVLLIINVIKSIYNICFTETSNRYENIFYILYSFVYVSIVFPAKIWALISIKDNTWGTSPRNNKSNNFSFDMCLLIIWNMVLLGGVASNIYRGMRRRTDLFEFLYMIVISSIYIISWCFMYIYLSVRRKNKKDK